MAANASQLESFQPGEALVTVTGKGTFGPNGRLDVKTLEFALEWPPNRFLQIAASSETKADAWSTKKTWMRPQKPHFENQALTLRLTSTQTWQLRANVNYLLHLRDSSGEVEESERLFWRAIRLPSQPPNEPPYQEISVDPEATGPAKNANANQPIGSGPQRSARLRWAAAAFSLLALGLVAAGLWNFGVPWTPSPSDVEKSAVVAPTVKSAREFLATGCNGPAAYAEADHYRSVGTPEAVQGMLLLLDCAAKTGDARAATAIGKMYDPSTFDRSTSPFAAPDLDRALVWYRRAADGKDPEGLYRLGMLLLGGKIEEPGLGPEAGVKALERAAALGSADAARQLEAVRTKR